MLELHRGTLPNNKSLLVMTFAWIEGKVSHNVSHKPTDSLDHGVGLWPAKDNVVSHRVSQLTPLAPDTFVVLDCNPKASSWVLKSHHRQQALFQSPQRRVHYEASLHTREEVSSSLHTDTTRLHTGRPPHLHQKVTTISSALLAKNNYNH
jgi:hypothetical protein